MNLHEEINRINKMMGLKEHTGESMYLLRRVPAQDISLAFRAALNLVSKKYVEKKSKWSMFNLEKFVHMVMGVMMDGLYNSFIDKSHEFPYERLYDYLHEKYLDEMVQRYTEITKENNEEESINESEIPTIIKRRINFESDEEILDKLKTWMMRSYDSENTDKQIKTAFTEVAWSLLSKLDSDTVSEDTINSIIEYLKDKYLDEILEFNDSLFGTENDNDKYCFIKSKQVFGGAGFSECVTGWHQFLKKYGFWLSHLDWNGIRQKLNDGPKNTTTRILLAKPLEKHPYEYYFSISKRND